MKILDDFILRNKIVNLKVRITDLMEQNIWNNAIINIKGNLFETHEVIHEDQIAYPIDITMHIDLAYSEYRKIIKNLKKFDRTLKYDPKTQVSYIIISVRNGLQKREVS
jgi:hypothetical protein